MNKQKLFVRLISSRKNVNYNDFTRLLASFGFKLARSEGSHHIYKNEGIAEMINIQNVDGKAKPYQIKQFLALVEKYDLRMEDRP